MPGPDYSGLVPTQEPVDLGEIRVSPDNLSVAVRSMSENADGWNSWVVVHRVNGGYWASAADVADWRVVDV